jgi:lysophospholipase L1-like esterase
MAREANLAKYGDGLREGAAAFINALERFEALVRADEREEGQKWFDAVTAQHKQLILAEREACAKVCDDKHDTWRWGDGADSVSGPRDCATAIRARKDK